MNKSNNLDDLIIKFINEHNELLSNASWMLEEEFKIRQFNLVKKFFILAKLVPFSSKGEKNDQ